MSGEGQNEAYIPPGDRPSARFTAETSIRDLTVRDLQELMKDAVESHLQVFDKWWDKYKPEPYKEKPEQGEKGFKEKPEPGEKSGEWWQYVANPAAMAQVTSRRFSDIDRLIQQIRDEHAQHVRELRSTIDRLNSEITQLRSQSDQR